MKFTWKDLDGYTHETDERVLLGLNSKSVKINNFKEVPGMFGTNKEAKKEAAEKVEYDVTVTAARTTKNDKIVMIDLKVNGVQIKSCMLKEIECKKDGDKHKKGDICYVVNLPSEKIGDKYYNIVWFPISNETMDKIIDQVQSLLK